MITWSKTVENKTSVDGESKGTIVQVKSTVAWSNVTGKPTTLAGYGITDAYTKAQSDAAYEPIFSKNTAFNKDFGTTGTTVAYGNHTHAGFTQDSANEVISGIWTFTGVAEFGVAPQFTAATGQPFTVAATAQTMVTNLNAEMLGGTTKSGFALSGHDHTGVYEPYNTAIAHINVVETVTANWIFSGTPELSGVPNFSNAILPFAVAATTGMVANLDANYLNGKADSAFELAIGAKGTAFNKNFGTTATTVATGNHTHSGFTLDSANEVISGAWTFTGIAEFGVAPQFTAATGSPFTVAATATTVVTNLNADMLDGSHASAFSLSGHTHTGVYEPADADITKRNEVETISANWIFNNTPEFSGVPNFSNVILPFTVHSNANLVTNLNADMLDGKHASEFSLVASGFESSGGFTTLVTSTDNVGIGTPAPAAAYRLEVRANLFTPVGYPTGAGSNVTYGVNIGGVGNRDSTKAVGLSFSLSSANNVTTPSWEHGRIIVQAADSGIGQSDGVMHLQTRSATGPWAWNPGITINAFGWVGINNANPTFSLSVSGTANATTLAEGGLNINTLYEPKDADITKKNEVEAVTAAWNFSGVPYFSNAILPFSVNATAGNVVNLDADKLDGLHASSFARMNLTNTGYFHATANTTTAAIRARQDGTGYIMDWYDGASIRGYMTQTGLLVSDDYKSLSDERLKDKFKKVKNGLMLDKVLEISKLIRTYERLDKNNELELGWGAQTLYKIAPEYVHKPDNKEDTWAVGYGKMVVPLYAAVSSINDRLKRVEKKLKL